MSGMGLTTVTLLMRSDWYDACLDLAALGTNRQHTAEDASRCGAIPSEVPGMQHSAPATTATFQITSCVLRRRRGGTVDYAALELKLKLEEAAQNGQS